MQIRTAKLLDRVQMSELASTLTRKFISKNLSHTAEIALLDSLSPETFDEHINQGYQYHVAELDDNIIGMIGIKDNKHLYHLFVYEAFQQQGVAKILWDTARDECIKKGNPGIFTVNSSINARKVYEKFGFVAQTDVLDRNGISFLPMKLSLPCDS